MNFDMRKWVMDGFRDAIGKRDDSWVIFNSAEWFKSGILQEEDMAELQRLMDNKNNPVEAGGPEDEVIM